MMLSFGEQNVNSMQPDIQNHLAGGGKERPGEMIIFKLKLHP
jgi:hypothetical protein